MSFLKKSSLAVCVMMLSLSAAFADDSTQQAELEKKFEKEMSGATLVGHFTVDGRENGNPLREERYEIASPKKLQGDQWVLTARIKYGDNDVNVPIPLNVYWAGDTPVISLTNISIPGLGNAFTSRVMFYDGRYAGTWQHGKVGGNLWGKIEYAKEKTDSENDK